jgi:hypothetical protein
MMFDIGELYFNFSKHSNLFKNHTTTNTFDEDHAPL